jgi:leader peptidase (prepilin peptidase)/N-methyltransferase
MTSIPLADILPATIGVTLILAVWFFAFGASLGSFLNVVAWRLPRGNTVRGSSECPSCKQRIRLRDNIPVVSFFKLKGKCRNCDFQIPYRYVLTEVVAGGCATLFFCLLFVFRGVNIPGWSTNSRFFIDDLLSNRGPVFEMIGFFLQHGLLMVMLLIVLLIKSQDDRLPSRLILMGWLMTLILGACTDTAIPVGIKGEILNITQKNYQTLLIPVVGGIAGIALGYVSGLVLSALVGKTNWIRMKTELAMICSLIGLSLGWQATVIISISSLMVTLLIGMRAKRYTSIVKIALTGTIAIATMTLLFICTWSVWV